MPGHTRMPLALVAGAAALTFALALAASAAASADRITKGEAQAVFDASATGGIAIRAHSPTLNGSPAASPPSDGVRINGFLASSGSHYCVLDWHVIGVNLTSGNGPGDTFTRKEIADLSAATEVVYVLDGVPLDIDRTPSRPDPNFVLLTDAYVFSAGRLMSPDELAVGEHTLRITITDPTGFFAESQINFFVDAAGTGACL